jgi:hypothetical protein
MASEVSSANQFVRAAIAAGIAAAGDVLRVYPRAAPESATPPYVVYSLVSSPASLGTGARHIHSRPLYLVLVWARADETSPAQMQAFADAVDDGLTGAAAQTIGDWRVAGCWRSGRGSIDDDDLVGGVRYLMRGAYYELHVHPV